ncbi:hypothetical protein [Thermoactinomyces vulgaris]|uniref:hypothetical protein n=1 Tax=Thermoactinomyces vulgaris TaxID=2026 RepID=UPI000A405E36|nr:hypothetical protein [Thermoactinomyces vulgaris]
MLLDIMKGRFFAILNGTEETGLPQLEGWRYLEAWQEEKRHPDYLCAEICAGG